MTNRTLPLVLCCLALSSCAPRQEGGTVRVAAAANLRVALDEIGRRFEAATGIRMVPTYGATAQLAQQIENGAPIDVFLAADTHHVDQLIARGLAAADTRALYARGRLVLWAPSHPEIKTLRDLAGPAIRQVGCAKPELAPYGAAAVQALQRERIWEQVQPKLVYAQSISAAKQFADSGNVAAAFTALSLVSSLGGHYVLIDERLHDPIDQALCIVKQSPQPQSAHKFRDFVVGEQGREIFGKYGYQSTSSTRGIMSPNASTPAREKPAAT